MFIYRTKGICPPEIHFELSGGILKNVNFVGGGCRGNAELIGRLLEGREAAGVLRLLEGIQCRNGTSCPDQLYTALQSAIRGDLEESGAIRVHDAPRQYRRVAVCSELKGDRGALNALLSLDAEALVCLGHITGSGGENDAVLEAAAGEKVFYTLGPREDPGSQLSPGNSERLCKAPHFITFRMGQKRVLGFYGGFISQLPGFSDFSRFSLELLMVSDLSDYLRKEEVFPALEAMTGQFEADVVLFAQTGSWRHVKAGRVDFINLGPVKAGELYRYALLEPDGDEIRVSFRNIGLEEGRP